jgi:hypothetical protein
MNELLMCIDQIDQSVNNAEINVLESLISSYDKALMILQECEVSDYSAFEIFQEGEKWEKFKEDSKAPILGNKGESLIKRILMIIPRLVQKNAALIAKAFTRNKASKQKMENDVQTLKQAVQTSEPFEKFEPNKFEPNKFEAEPQQQPQMQTIEPPKIDESEPQAPGNEETNLEDVILHVKGATFFGQRVWDLSKIFDKDSDLESPAIKVSFSIPMELYGKQEANDKVREALHQVDQTIKRLEYEYKLLEQGRKESREFHVRIGDAVEVFEKMKAVFNERHDKRNQTINTLNSIIKDLDKANAEFKKKYDANAMNFLRGFQASSMVMSEEQWDEYNRKENACLQLWLNYTQGVSEIVSLMSNITATEMRVWDNNYKVVMDAVNEIKNNKQSDLGKTKTINLSKRNTN